MHPRPTSRNTLTHERFWNVAMGTTTNREALKQITISRAKIGRDESPHIATNPGMASMARSKLFTHGWARPRGYHRQLKRLEEQPTKATTPVKRPEIRSGEAKSEKVPMPHAKTNLTSSKTAEDPLKRLWNPKKKRNERRPEWQSQQTYVMPNLKLKGT